MFLTALDISEQKVRRNEVGLWLGWTLATTVGMLAGLLPFLLWVESLDLWLARILIPLSAGFLVGFFQWLVLQRYLTHSADWILSGGAGWSLGYALGLLIIQALRGTLIGEFIGYLIFGALIAVVQWPVLRREIPKAVPWVLTNVFAWALGSYLGQLILNLVVTQDTVSQGLSSAVISGVTGLVAGAITGVALVWTVRQPERPSVVVVAPGGPEEDIKEVV
jgi:hypothetical protein